MTSQMNLEEIYIELNALLKDVCSFLTSEANNEGLSGKAKNEAQKLVSRSKEQVEVISKISALQESSNSNYPYLQMQSPNLITEPLGDYVEADFQHYESDYELADYAEIKHNETQLTTISSIEEECPYLHLQQDTVSDNAEKYGPLIRKERYFLIGPKKHIFAGLIGCYLLIYNSSKKETRPSEFVNVIDYTAQVLENRKDFAFEITAPDKRQFQFMARSSKDMNQWVFAINYKKQRAVNIFPINKQSISMAEYEEDLQTYETVDDLKKQNILQTNNLVSKEESLQPVLPLRTHNNYLNSKHKNVFNFADNNMKVDNNDLEDDEDDEDNIYHSVSSNFRPIPEQSKEAHNSVKKPIDIRNISPIILNHVPSKVSTVEEINKIKETNIRESITDEDLVDYDEPREIAKNYTPNIKSNSSFQSSSNTRNDIITKNATKEELPIYDNTKEVPVKTNENTPKKAKNKPEVPAKIISKPATSPKPKDITSSTFPRKAHKTEGLTHIQKICQQIEMAKIFKPKS